ncbi:hypothetical protein [Pseudomonas xanthosomatis]|uniref:hypothetical protein n=1 Tax=Pseudomonas xanthosomatis TaxID=2842356 RepID=UPI003F59B88F
MASNEAGMLRVALAGLALSVTAGPAGASTELAGVWHGTLGKSAITACFNTDTESGSYYYQRFLAPIRLAPKAAGEPWAEEGDTGLWQLNAPQGDSLTGTWSKAKGGKALPVALTRSSAENCGGDDYNAPMEAAPLPVKVQKTTFEGHVYQTKTQGSEVTLTLVGDGPAIAKVNQQLARLAVDPEAQEQYFEERRRSLGYNGYVATSEITVEPVYRSSGWLTVKFYRWAAGMGANGIGWGLHSWNLRTGESVDPWAWLGMDYQWYSPYGGHVSLSEPFATWLRTQAEADDGCPDVASYSYYDLSFNTQGMRLANHASGDGCDVDVSASWKQLEPFLSAQGRQALGSLQEP